MNIPSKNLISFFFYFVKKQWTWFLAIQLLCFCWSLDHTLWPYFLMKIVDTLSSFEGEKSQIWAALSTPLLMGAALWIYVEASFRLSGILMAKLFPKFEAKVRMAMFDYVQKHSSSYFANNFAGSIANKISDMTHNMNLILQLVLGLFLPVFLALIIATTLFASINPLFALLLIGWITMHLTICYCFSKGCSRYSKQHGEMRSMLSGKLIDSLSNQLNVKLFANHRFEKQYLSNFQKKEQQAHQKSLFYMEKMKIALGIVCFFGAGIGINWLMLSHWQNDLITTAEVVFIFNMSWNITMMAWYAGLEFPKLFEAIGICKQALTVMQDSHEVVDHPLAKELQIAKGEIFFDKVTFRYPGRAPLFKEKSLKIPGGQRVGLVGFSGAGKTTFVHLLLRYFDIESGKILIDSQEIAQATQESLRGQIALIPQDTSLFHRSLLENIRYGKPEASLEEVVEAARKAHCHEFIELLPEKYETLVGERGVKLSGGQRQRIAIARAILKNAPILMLDEATSALDSVTEQKIQEGLSYLMEGRTTLVIAHRLSTLTNLDRILVFKDGRIVEDGHHDALISIRGHYAQLWQMQAGGFILKQAC